MTKFLFIFIIVFSSAGCSDEILPEEVVELEGEWTAVTFNAYVSNQVPGENFVFSKWDIVGADIDYDITFTDSTFMTMGNYSYNTEVDLEGLVMFPSVDTLTNVSKSGTYNLENDSLAIDGKLFDFVVSGQHLSLNAESINSEVKINDFGQLEVCQTGVSNFLLVFSSNSINFMIESTWERK